MKEKRGPKVKVAAGVSLIEAAVNRRQLSRRARSMNRMFTARKMPAAIPPTQSMTLRSVDAGESDPYVAPAIAISNAKAISKRNRKMFARKRSSAYTRRTLITFGAVTFVGILRLAAKAVFPDQQTLAWLLRPFPQRICDLLHMPATRRRLHLVNDPQRISSDSPEVNRTIGEASDVVEVEKAQNNGRRRPAFALSRRQRLILSSHRATITRKLEPNSSQISLHEDVKVDRFIPERHQRSGGYNQLASGPNQPAVRHCGARNLAHMGSGMTERGR